MQYFSVSFDGLNEAFTLAKSMLSSKASAKSRALIFNASQGTVEFSAWTNGGIMRTSLEVDDFALDDQWIFQVKPEDLNKIIQPFTSLSVTRVSGIRFTKHDTSVIVTISEEPVGDYGDEYAQESHFRLGVTPPSGQIVKAVQEEFPSETEDLPALILNEYIRALQPLIANEAAAGTASTLYIVEDFVYVATNSLFAAFTNRLPEALSNTSFQYGTVSTLKILAELALRSASGKDLEEIEDSDLMLNMDEDTDLSTVDPKLFVNLDLGTIKTDEGKTKYIAVRYDKTSILISPQASRFASYEAFTNKIYHTDDDGNYTNRGTGFAVDRLYFQSVIKRLSFGDDVSFEFEGDSLKVSTKGFDQLVPLTNHRGDLESIKFSVNVTRLQKLILGEDKKYAESSPDVYFYLIKETRGYSLYVLDELDAWVSALSVSSR